MADGSDSSGGVNSGKSSRADRRTFLKATGAGAVALGTAGCVGNLTGGDGGDGGNGGGVPETIKIGVLAPEPANNSIGASIANSAKLAAKQFNENGGIAGADVEVIVKDTKETPSTGRERYRELALEDQVHVTTGVFTSEVLLDLMGEIAEQQKVHMTTGAATPEASKQVNEDYEQFKYHFRTGPINAHHLGVNLVDFGKAMFDQIGWEQIAILVEDYKWTEPVSSVLEDRASETGAEIVMNERYASGTEDFSTIYDQVASSGADVAFTAMAHTGTPAVVQWAQQQRPFAFGGIHVPMQLPAYYQAVEGACRFGVTQNSATPQAEITENTQPYVQAYNDEYDSYPVYTGYITYDAVNQFKSVVESEESVNADDLVAGLEESSHTGTAGTIEYYGKEEEWAHDVIYDREKVFPIYQQWQEGEDGGVQEVIFPEEHKTADYQSPPWVQ